ncbi:MAG: methionine ABC transporter substrate-binding lipoprotein MetQ [Prevotella sp.]|jgi:D-methionine transport system substrate-binding protein|nr:methionine ABC transporter substrate-binding lipoprotein MetQ [Prevotella sp.]MDR2001438.1 methionine ABC transporter substrate-binding lipoprotein MetQ [Prevotella sp.]
MKIITCITVILIFTLSLASCGNRKSNDPNHIRVGVATGPEYVIAEAAKKVAKEKYGLEVELVQFNDYIMPNTSLEQGDIDANVFQTKPFLDEQISRRGYRFAIVGNTFIYPMAAYSKKIKSLDELKDGSTIVMPNDFANSSRALLLLQKVGLVKLKDGVTAPRLLDITENPRNLEILELEAPQLPRVLDDAKVSLSVINNNFAGQAGLLLKDGVFAEDKDSPYVNLIVTREENKEEEKVKKFVQAYQSDEVDKVATEVFKGGAVKGW